MIITINVGRLFISSCREGLERREGKTKLKQWFHICFLYLVGSPIWTCRQNSSDFLKTSIYETLFLKILCIQTIIYSSQKFHDVTMLQFNKWKLNIFHVNQSLSSNPDDVMKLLTETDDTQKETFFFFWGRRHRKKCVCEFY